MSKNIPSVYVYLSPNKGCHHPCCLMKVGTLLSAVCVILKLAKSVLSVSVDDAVPIKAAADN